MADNPGIDPSALCVGLVPVIDEAYRDFLATLPTVEIRLSGHWNDGEHPTACVTGDIDGCPECQAILQEP